MKTGAELKARREELKITQQDLADKIGVSRTQLSRMENGKIEINNYIRTKIEAILTNSEEYKESELTINDIQVGDELECIDRDGFNDCHLINNNIKSFVVDRFRKDGVVVGNDYIIYTEELKYFRKKPKLQFSDLEVGDYVYVCDDLVDGYMYGEWSWHDDMLKGKLLKIGEIGYGGYINDGMVYTPEMIDLSRSMKKEDYLKMNENEEKFDFSDLCLKANKAVDDGLLSKFIRHENCIEFFGDYVESFGEHRADKAHEYIQSLYTEKFVIECEKDICNTKDGANLVLANGNSVKFRILDGMWKITENDKNFHSCGLLVLKGATVEQSKGDK